MPGPSVSRTRMKRVKRAGRIGVPPDNKIALMRWVRWMDHNSGEPLVLKRHWHGSRSAIRLNMAGSVNAGHLRSTRAQHPRAAGRFLMWCFLIIHSPYGYHDLMMNEASVKITSNDITAPLGGEFTTALELGEIRSSGRTEAQDSSRLRRIAFGLFFVYMAVAVAIYLWRGIWFTPDRWAVFLLIAAVVLGQLGPFLRDWIPFVLLIFGYEYLRGIAGDIVAGGKAVWDMERAQLPGVHLEALIHMDEVLFFGHSPIRLLQDPLYELGNPRWWDFFALIMYSMHFVLPCAFAFVLWLTNKRRFWTFTLTFCFMTYVAFAFFLLFPAAPPWLAQAWGVESGLWFPQNDVLAVIQPDGFNTLDTYSIWGNASPHPVAAMPSLHASSRGWCCCSRFATTATRGCGSCCTTSRCGLRCSIPRITGISMSWLACSGRTFPSSLFTSPARSLRRMCGCRYRSWGSRIGRDGCLSNRSWPC